MAARSREHASRTPYLDASASVRNLTAVEKYLTAQGLDLIEQGLEVHRPSRIFVRAEKAGDKIVNVHVGGYCVEVAQGEFWI